MVAADHPCSVVGPCCGGATCVLRMRLGCSLHPSEVFDVVDVPVFVDSLCRHGEPESVSCHAAILHAEHEIKGAEFLTFLILHLHEEPLVVYAVTLIASFPGEVELRA